MYSEWLIVRQLTDMLHTNILFQRKEIFGRSVSNDHHMLI